MVATSGTDTARALRPYLPRVALRALAEAPGPHVAMLPGTLVFADVSGFTKLSERLARLGAEGAERISEAIGDLVRLAARGRLRERRRPAEVRRRRAAAVLRGRRARRARLRAAVGMRRALRAAGPVVAPGARTTLRMSMGVHSGTLAALPRRPLAPRAGRRRPGRHRRRCGWRRPRRRARSSSPRRSPRRSRRGWSARRAGRACCSRPRRAGRTSRPHEPPLPARRRRSRTGSRPRCAARAGRRRRARAPARHGRVRALRRRRRARRSARPTRPAQRSTRCVDGRPAACRGARGRPALRRRRRRRREARCSCAGAPRAVGDEEERMLLDAARDRRRRRPAAAPARRQPRPRVHRRHRAATTAARTPRWATWSTSPRGSWRKAPAGGIYATAGVLERSATRFDAHPHARRSRSRARRAPSRRGPSARRRGRERSGDAERRRSSGATSELELLRGVLAEARGGEGRYVELAGAAGHRQDAARRGDARRGRGADHPARDLRAARRRRPVRRLARAPAAADRRGLGRPARRRWSRVCGRPSPSAAPDLEPWLPLLAAPARRRRCRHAEVAALSPAFRADRLHDAVVRFLARIAARRRRCW